MHDPKGAGPMPEYGADPSYAEQPGMNPEQMAHMPPYGYYGAYAPPEPPPYYGYPYAGYMPPPPPPYPPGYGPHPGMPPHMQPPPTPSPEQAELQSALNDMADKSGLGMLKGLFKMDDSEFWKGALVGAAAVLLLTNDSVRESLLSGATKTAEAMKSSLGGAAPNDAEDQDFKSDTTED